MSSASATRTATSRSEVLSFLSSRLRQIGIFLVLPDLQMPRINTVFLDGSGREVNRLVGLYSKSDYVSQVTKLAGR